MVNGRLGAWGPWRIGSFLNHLANSRGISASTQNQALSALIFLYREVLGRDPGQLTGLARAASARRTGLSFSHLTGATSGASPEVSRSISAALMRPWALEWPVNFTHRRSMMM